MSGADGIDYEPQYQEPLDVRDSYSSPADADDELDPRRIAVRLIAEYDDFQDLRDGEATVLFLFRQNAKDKGGKAVLAEMCLPTFGGALGAVGLWMLARLCNGLPSFVMVIDYAWWEQASPLQREALVAHELRHGRHALDKDGCPKFSPDGDVTWGIRPHDLEEFDCVVREYGAYLPDVARFAAALKEGGAA